MLKKTDSTLCCESSGRVEDEITKLKSQLKGFHSVIMNEDKRFLKLLFSIFRERCSKA